jgi:hypothetical protein
MSSSSTDDSSDVESWVEWFLIQEGHEFLCEVDRSYIGACRPRAAPRSAQRERSPLCGACARVPALSLSLSLSLSLKYILSFFTSRASSLSLSFPL